MTNNSAPFTYAEYLNLESVLNSQRPKSRNFGREAHDETLFIIIHQVYELWFKEILHEIDSLIKIFNSDFVEDRVIAVAVARINRVNEIQRILIQQIKVIETLTPLDFLEFRKYLGSASGFQSVQFRLIENRLGLGAERRLAYSRLPYPQLKQDERELLLSSETDLSLFTVVERWLVRTPFLDYHGFNFMTEYKAAVNRIFLRAEQEINSNSELSEAQRQMQININRESLKNFGPIFNQTEYEKLRSTGQKCLSYEALLSALFIFLYRDEPILQLPFNLLQGLIEVDELLTLWRYQHALMALRMLGRQMGTGGSAGHDYLKSTVEKHRIFLDLFEISTCLIPRSELSPLPAEAKKGLSFHYLAKE